MPLFHFPSSRHCWTRSAAVLLLAGLLLSSDRALATETDGAVEARSVALDLAGAFSNDGYKIRDGHWSGSLKPGEPQVLTVNLYAGNQYYFVLGAADKAGKVSITVFGEDGKPVPGQQFYEDKERAVSAAGVSPVASGPYYVKVQIAEGNPADFCLIYTYK